jgi:hypothetical protein
MIKIYSNSLFPQVCVVIRIFNSQKGATIARFYMTQTSLSAATPAHRENPCPAARLKWHGRALACAQLPSLEVRLSRAPHRYQADIAASF